MESVRRLGIFPERMPDDDAAEADSFEVSAHEDDFRLPQRRRPMMNRETGILVRGIIIGFGLAAAANAFFNIFQEQRSRRKSAMSPESRMRRQDESGGVVGDLSNLVDEGTSAFRDAVRTVDNTCESVTRGLESIGDVIHKIRQ
jgi:hypothetical protein